ncbi:MAG: prephenate dehydrogenase/arogenate dehydrogenase family protein [Chloroflexi bacterium]|nr:prephenate dehydrogenase/arogenate dehydrogenase family protein [Chloroflexota bacterium]
MTGGFQARNLAIVGLGLMGGSLALAVRARADHIIGIDSDEQARQVALERGLVDSATDDLYAGVNRADVVILATPVRVIIELLRMQLGSYLRSNTLVVDIGSTKQDIVAAMAALPIGVNAVGGHPMTGKENGGIDGADGALYHNRPFVLCPSRRTTPAARLRARALVQSLGGLPIEMDAERHDHIVAGISHLPYLLSATLVATIANRAQDDKTFWALAAGGFRDTSRLAASDVTMMGDILSTNTQAVATLLAQFRMQLAMLETMLIAGDEERLGKSLLPIQAARKEWARKYEKGR